MGVYLVLLYRNQHGAIIIRIFFSFFERNGSRLILLSRCRISCNHFAPIVSIILLGWFFFARHSNLFPPFECNAQKVHLLHADHISFFGEPDSQYMILMQCTFLGNGGWCFQVDFFFVLLERLYFGKFTFYLTGFFFSFLGDGFCVRFFLRVVSRRLVLILIIFYVSRAPVLPFDQKNNAL